MYSTFTGFLLEVIMAKKGRRKPPESQLLIVVVPLTCGEPNADNTAVARTIIGDGSFRKNFTIAARQ
jgi:hypothetical protein